MGLLGGGKDKRTPAQKAQDDKKKAEDANTALKKAEGRGGGKRKDLRKQAGQARAQAEASAKELLKSIRDDPNSTPKQKRDAKKQLENIKRVNSDAAAEDLKRGLANDSANRAIADAARNVDPEARKRGQQADALNEWLKKKGR